MCGIVGAVAERQIAQILLAGLQRLEYRGYDSAGMAIFDPQAEQIQRLRVLGKVDALAQALQAQALPGQLGIAHTRWATHGKPCEKNAHPHCSADSEWAVVHNGIIENHQALREKLVKTGYTLNSDTDSEIIAHLLHHNQIKHPEPRDAIRATIAELDGAFALGIVHRDAPDTLWAVKHASPLVIGIGIGEHFIASDTLALLPMTNEFIFLEDGDIAQLSMHNCDIYNLQDQQVERPINTSATTSQQAHKGAFRHFMLKEIFEQPETFKRGIRQHIVNGRLAPESFQYNACEIFQPIERIQIVACGTSYHAALVSQYWFEQLAKRPCRVDIASEYRYRDSVVEPNGLFIAISQSGETADTLAALTRAKTQGYRTTLAITNVANSSLARTADINLLTRAGPEIGVAATKTFTGQLISLLLLTLLLAESGTNNIGTEIESAVSALALIPTLAEQVLSQHHAIQAIAPAFSEQDYILFIGRQLLYPLALEGALKLKEISYLHAEAYAAGELKHGPLALIEDGTPVVIIASQDSTIDKLQSNVEEVCARGARPIIISDQRLSWPNNLNATVISLPEMPATIAPILYALPLQLLAYYIAVLKGTDIDQPRNLAKSVTVE